MSLILSYLLFKRLFSSVSRAHAHLSQVGFWKLFHVLCILWWISVGGSGLCLLFLQHYETPPRHWKIHFIIILYYNLVQWKSYVWLFVTPWTAVHKVSLPLTIFQVLPEIKSIDCTEVYNFFLLSNTCLLLISLFLRIRVFTLESQFFAQLVKALEIQLQRQWF